MASNNYYAIILLIVVVALNASACCKANSFLTSGERLMSGESLRNGNFVLTMQPNCNLVLSQGTSPIWATNTRGTGCSCIMQNDGNFVIHSSTGSVLWASDSWQGNRHRYYVLALQKDGNLVIYGPSFWATNTARTTNTNETGSIINMVTSTGV